MTIVVRMTWPGVTREQYDEVRRAANWIAEPPVGGLVHLASFDEGSVLHVTDVWEDAQLLDDFLQQRIMPAVAGAGITSAPVMEIDSCHEVFIPQVNGVPIPHQDRVLAMTPL